LENDERETARSFRVSSFEFPSSFDIRASPFIFIGQFCHLLSVEIFQIKFVAIYWKLV
jgi:hypothetical protein